MNHWLDVCEERHSLCKVDGLHIDSAEFILPTRLLHIGNKKTFLVDSSLLPRTSQGFGPPYATLSYCWGPNSELVPKCTTANINELQENIDVDTLPKTFQDAAAIVKKLGVRYLWIDSLCIIQDDPHDKEIEISRMHLNYSMAICCIVAAAAPDVQGGCFVERRNPDAKSFSMAMKDEDTDLTVTMYPHLSDFFDAVSNGPLATRGWTFQERQLSKRVIYFTERYIAWECRDAVATEDFPEMSERRWYGSGAKMRNGPHRLLDCLPAGVDMTQPNWIAEMNTRAALIQLNPTYLTRGIANRKHHHWMKKWGPIVEEFSSRSLSLETDRLPALGGLAAVISALLESPFDSSQHIYVAGLFLTDILRQLCWFPNVQDPRSRRSVDIWPPPPRDAPACTVKTISDKATLPSWSWISLDCPVCYYGCEDFGADKDLDPVERAEFDSHLPIKVDVRPRIDECKVDLVTPSFNFGSVSAGVLTITGLTLQLDISESDHISKQNAPALPKCYAMFGDSNSSQDTNLPFLNIEERGVIYFDVEPKELPKTTLYCIRLGWKPSLVSASTPVDVGLVLLEVQEAKLPDGTSAGQRFRRVGMFEMACCDTRFLENSSVRSVIII
jgi:hypothetical protein